MRLSFSTRGWQSLDWEQLLAAVTPVSRLSAQGEQVSVWP